MFVPARDLCYDLYLSELDIVGFACCQTSALNRVDDGASGRITDGPTGLPLLVRASSEVVGVIVEDSGLTDDVGGQGRENVQLSVFDEGIGRRISRHLEFAVSEVQGRSIR